MVFVERITSPGYNIVPVPLTPVKYSPLVSVGKV